MQKFVITIARGFGSGGKEIGVKLAERLGIPFECFSSQQLRQVPGEFSTSPFVQSVVGVDNVCERSAVLASGGTLCQGKTARDGITMALALAPYQPNWRWQVE